MQADVGTLQYFKPVFLSLLTVFNLELCFHDLMQITSSFQFVILTHSVAMQQQLSSSHRKHYAINFLGLSTQAALSKTNVLCIISIASVTSEAHKAIFMLFFMIGILSEHSILLMLPTKNFLLILDISGCFQKLELLGM